MTEEDDSPRLDVDPNTPAELRELLRALGEEGPGSVRLAAVAQRLGPVLDAPLPIAASRGAYSLLNGHGVTLKLAVALLAVGGVVTWFATARPPRGHDDLSVSVAAPAKPIPQPRAVRSAPAATEREQEREQKAAVAPGREILEAQPELGLERTRSSHRPGGKPVPRLHAEQRQPAVAPREPSARSNSKVASASSGGLAVVTAPAVADAGSSMPAALDNPPPPRGKSEIELVSVARAQAKREPVTSLRLLDEHALRFPDGMLAPEREVLAIEVLRALGKGEAAAARLQAFREHYPGSVHLRRLENARKD